jgi:hypothetical protein
MQLEESYFLTSSPNVSKNTMFRKLDLFPFRRPNRVGAAIILPEDGNIRSFRNVVFLETLDEGQSTNTWFFQVSYNYYGYDKIFTNHRDSQLSFKYFQSSETNQITNIPLCQYPLYYMVVKPGH